MNTTASRLDYQVTQSVTKSFGIGNYIRVKLENIPVLPHFLVPLKLVIGDLPAIDLTVEQKEHLAIALKMDETTLQVLQMLEKRVVHGDNAVRKNLAKLFVV